MTLLRGKNDNLDKGGISVTDRTRRATTRGDTLEAEIQSTMA